MISLRHWLAALVRSLKRDKRKQRIEEEARLELEEHREKMRAEALVEVERLGLIGGRPHEMRLGTYRRPERSRRLQPADESRHHEPPFLPPLPMSLDSPATSMPDPSPSFDPGGPPPSALRPPPPAAGREV
jgi:hypothetical protein